MARVFSAEDQISIIDTVSAQYGGCLAVTTQYLSNPSPDPIVRDASLHCDYGVIAFVHASAWSGGDVDGAECASDVIDALLGLAIPMIASWEPDAVPYHNPIVVAEEDVPLDPTIFPDTLYRGIRVRTTLYYPTVR